MKQVWVFLVSLVVSVLIVGCSTMEMAKLGTDALFPPKEGIEATVQLGKENIKGGIVAETEVTTSSSEQELHEVTTDSYSYNNYAMPWYAWFMIITALLIGSPLDDYFEERRSKRRTKEANRSDE